MVHWSMAIVGFMVGVVFGVFIIALLSAGSYFEEDPKNAPKRR